MFKKYTKKVKGKTLTFYSIGAKIDYYKERLKTGIDKSTGLKLTNGQLRYAKNRLNYLDTRFNRKSLQGFVFHTNDQYLDKNASYKDGRPVVVIDSKGDYICLVPSYTKSKKYTIPINSLGNVSSFLYTLNYKGDVINYRDLFTSHKRISNNEFNKIYNHEFNNKKNKLKYNYWLTKV